MTNEQRKNEMNSTVIYDKISGRFLKLPPTPTIHKHEFVESGFGKTYKARCITCNYIRGQEQARLNGLELDPTGNATWRNIQ